MKTVTLPLEFVKQAHKAACEGWKRRIEEHVPELRKSKLKLKKWHKSDLDGSLIFFDSIDDEENIVGYGLNDGVWDDCREDGTNWGSIRDEKDWTPATDKEVEAALIAEAEKRGFKEGSEFIPLHIDGRNYCTTQTINGCEPFRYDSENWLSNDNYRFFSNGKWAEVIKNPIQKEIDELQKQIYKLKLKL